MKRKIDNPHQKILDSALTEFSAHGYEKASTNNIARLAGISKGSVFHYYHTKEELFREVISFSIELFKKELRYFTIKAREPDQIIKESIHFIHNFYSKNKNIYNFYLKSIYDVNLPYRTDLVKVVRLFSTFITYKIMYSFKKLSLLNRNFSEEAVLYLFNSVISRIIDSNFMEKESPMENTALFDELIRLLVYTTTAIRQER